MPAAISGPRCRDIASVNAWNAGMNLLRSEKQQMFACKHWLIREATGPFCAEICLRSSQYQRTRSNKVVQNPGSYGAPVLKRASPFSGHPTASALPSWPQAAQTSEAGHLDVRHSCSMPLTMHRHSQGPEKLLDDLLLNQAPPVAQRFEISPELALCPLLAEEAVAAS